MRERIKIPVEKMQKVQYPFCAVVGHEKAKLSLVLNAINPRIGGVLISGAKGIGKSVLIRGLAEILPEGETVEGCHYNCNPHDRANMCELCRIRLKHGEVQVSRKKMKIIELPLGATEDRVLGSIDVERAFREGLKGLQHGLLAEANQNVLYIDEINLLPDHLVNTILDPAASGWNIVEREGISLTHPSRFVLIASMNPEEGNLRPQILDRFPLHVKLDTINDLTQRTEIIKRNMVFEENPEAFRKNFEQQQENLRKRILAARELLPEVQTSEAIYKSIAKFCSDLRVDGHRPDIVILKAAEALAAFEGRKEVTPEDVITVSDMALSHRTRMQGLKGPLPPYQISREVRKGLFELKLIAPPASKEEKAPLLTPEEVREAMSRLARRYKTHKVGVTKKPKRQSPLIRAISLLSIPLLIVFSSYLFSVMILLIYFSIFGSPPENLTALFSVDRTLPLTLTLAIVFSLLLILSGRRRKTPVIFFYDRRGKELPRKVLPFHLTSKETYTSLGEHIIISLSGAYIHRVYRALVNYGKKVANTFSQLFSEPSGGFSISVEGTVRMGRRLLPSKRSKITSTRGMRGRYVWYELPKEKPWEIALPPTIRAAATHQKFKEPGELSLKITPQDLRVKVRESPTPLTIILLLDMSESMSMSLENVRKAVLSLHESAIRRRDRVGLIVFKGSDATLLQHPTTNLNLIVRKLLKVGTSDFTPLATGMLKAWRKFRMERTKNKDILPLLVIVSDGITNVPLDRPLSPFTRSKLLNHAQADVIDVAHLLAKDQIHIVVINTAHHPEELDIQKKKIPGWYTPTAFLFEVSRITKGRYYGLSEKGIVQTIVLTEAITAMPHSF